MIYSMVQKFCPLCFRHLYYYMPAGLYSLISFTDPLLSNIAQDCKFAKPATHIDLYDNNFILNVIKFWNSLSPDILNSSLCSQLLVKH